MNSEELKIIESYLLDREKPNYEIAGKLMKICEAMTDEDVKKAMLHCAKHGTCERCTLYIEDDDRCDCSSVLKLAALNIINCQHAEIERLTLEYAGFEAGVKHIIKSIKAEAIKEFAERLKEHAYRLPTSFFEIKAVNESWIDAILKEMVGESK